MDEAWNILYVLDWPKSSFGFSHSILWQSRMNFLANPILFRTHLLVDFYTQQDGFLAMVRYSARTNLCSQVLICLLFIPSQTHLQIIISTLQLRNQPCELSAVSEHLQALALLGLWTCRGSQHGTSMPISLYGKPLCIQVSIQKTLPPGRLPWLRWLILCVNLTRLGSAQILG